MMQDGSVCSEQIGPFCIAEAIIWYFQKDFAMI